MPLNDNGSDPDMDILETAADWVDRLGELTPAERRELESWLETDAEHRRAFSTVRHAFMDTALLTAARQVESEQSRPAARRPTGAFRPALIAAGLAVAVLAGAGVMLTLPTRPEPKVPAEAPVSITLATAIGARADHTLSDKSVVHMNADTRLDILFDAHARNIRLTKGDAMFDVAHNAARPFTVAAGGATVTAVGTRFEVDLLNDAVEVRVFDGVVSVRHADQPARLLNKGRWLLLAANGSSAGGDFDPETYASWRNDWLDARNMPLGHVVARLNRYAVQPLVLSDPKMGDLPVTGRFRLDQPEASRSMIQALLAGSAADEGGH
ncbi:FecR family protein [Caulobacter sp. NIBR2454]|uniref:FecR family protein n=1 Tax=Caulobacter sp. NIBR2454 TaxID=3015996 RepID=UPI0022B6CB73|nr:FecR domain-containing protein [Caulobacter sp. NIBR2454]